MAMLGNRVIGYESDPAKLRAISNAEIPFHEPGLEYQLAELSGSGLFSVADHFGEGNLSAANFRSKAEKTRKARPKKLTEF